MKIKYPVIAAIYIWLYLLVACTPIVVVKIKVKVNERVEKSKLRAFQKNINGQIFEQMNLTIKPDGDSSILILRGAYQIGDTIMIAEGVTILEIVSLNLQNQELPSVRSLITTNDYKVLTWERNIIELNGGPIDSVYDYGVKILTGHSNFEIDRLNICTDSYSAALIDSICIWSAADNVEQETLLKQGNCWIVHPPNYYERNKRIDSLVYYYGSGKRYSVK